MAIVLGPVLGFRGIRDGQWCISIMTVTNNNQPPQFGATGNGAKIEGGEELASFEGCIAWRTNLSIPMENKPRTVHYQLADESWTIHVPAKDAMPDMAYASCNGFSSEKLKKSFKPPHFGMWEDLQATHKDKPYHLLLLGGDQVYADMIWETNDALSQWLGKDMAAGTNDTLTAPQLKSIEQAFFSLYCRTWNAATVREMMATIPTVMMWDDHDIIDGWGSYPEARQQSKIFGQVFQIARRCFSVFQHHCAPGNPPTGPEYLSPANGFSFLHRIGPLALLGLDLRSERTMTQVMTPGHWSNVFGGMDKLRGLKHLLVLSSIPVVHADFTDVETSLGIIPGQQELEDDLRDHWSSEAHKEERVRLVHRLLNFSSTTKTRVTILSGDVHVGGLGVIESRRSGHDGNAAVINQLTSSGIVHPTPPAIVLFALEHLFGTKDSIERGIEAEMVYLPGTRSYFIGARNWLSLEPEPVTPNIWACWHAENIGHRYKKAIHAI